MRPGLLSVFAAFSVGVWILALVGVASVATTIASPDAPETKRPPSLLIDIPGLPTFPDSPPTTYNKSLQEGRLITEVEYVVARPVTEVGEFYGSVFEQEGWTVKDESVVGGERIYSVTLADRRASVKIDRVGGSTQVRIELIEPMTARGVTSDR